MARGCLAPLARGDLVAGQRAARAIVAPGAAGFLGGVALRRQVRRRAVAVVRVTGGDEAIGHRPIAIDPLRLRVGAVRPADPRPFVPIEAEPSQAVENALDHVGRRALDVGVLDAQHEHAAMTTGKEPVEERGPRAADVQIAGRRRRESHAGCGHDAIVTSGYNRSLDAAQDVKSCATTTLHPID